MSRHEGNDGDSVDASVPNGAHDTQLDELVTATAETLKAMAHPHRIRMLYRMLERERPVAWLAADAKILPHAASSHLRLMQRIGMVKGTRRGKFVYYRIRDAQVQQIVSVIGAWIHASPA